MRDEDRCDTESVVHDGKLENFMPQASATADSGHANEVLKRLSERRSMRRGRRPGELIRAAAALVYSIRTERVLVSTDCSLLFRWFVGLAVDGYGLGSLRLLENRIGCSSTLCASLVYRGHGLAEQHRCSPMALLVDCT